MSANSIFNSTHPSPGKMWHYNREFRTQFVMEGRIECNRVWNEKLNVPIKGQSMSPLRWRKRQQLSHLFQSYFYSFSTSFFCFPPVITADITNSMLIKQWEMYNEEKKYQIVDIERCFFPQRNSRKQINSISYWFAPRKDLVKIYFDFSQMNISLFWNNYE